MKVQLQKNYSNRNLTQRTNKAEAFKNPNFKSTITVSDESGKGLNWLLARGIEIVMESHRPTSKVERGSHLDGGVRLLTAYFSDQKDGKVIASLKGALNGEKGVKIQTT